jgi:hypothetical protein
MKKINLYEKESWGAGPWMKEPDYAYWIDGETFYPCVARRNLFGAWLGHVAVDSKHPLYLLDWSAAEFEFIDTHGSPNITTGFYGDDAKYFQPPQKWWWIGFSCMTEGDFCPWTDNRPATKGRKVTKKSYRDFNYVVEQIEILASQLASFDSRFV